MLCVGLATKFLRANNKPTNGWWCQGDRPLHRDGNTQHNSYKSIIGVHLSS